jgi:hypothetical protein
LTSVSSENVLVPAASGGIWMENSCRGATSPRGSGS